MIRVRVYDSSGNPLEAMQLDEAALGGSVKYELLRAAVAVYESRKRVGTHATRSRSEVAGSGKKMYRQKHTGLARAGMIRAPHRRGGGMAFGLDSPNYRRDLPRQAKRAALRSALLARLLDDEVAVFGDLNLKKPKTKVVAELLPKLNPDRGSLLVVTGENGDVLYKSARNLAGVTVRRVRDLNAYDVLCPQRVLFARSALQELVRSLT
jgi:large subunit ribosomal protein L4